MAGVAALGGCAAEPVAWIRPDGQPINSAQLELDEMACKLEVEKVAIRGQAKNTVDSPIGTDRQDKLAYLACMADRGFQAAPVN
jgi:hypothetical protein